MALQVKALLQCVEVCMEMMIWGNVGPTWDVDVQKLDGDFVHRIILDA